MESKELTRLIIELLEDKKALKTESFYMEKKTILADYYIVCTGTSVTHIKALANEIEEKLKEKGIELLHKEGFETARWILLDYGTVVVHIMHEVDRGYYDLETLFEKGHEQKRQG
jgi:ribosome-associated protein